MGSRPLRMKVRWGCPPRVLSPPPHRTQSWRPCLPGQPWASGWRSTDRPVPSPRGWTIGFSERGAAHNRALPRCLSSRRCMRSWRVRGWPLSRPEAARPPPPSSLPSMAEWPGGTRAFERAVAVHLCPRNAATWRNRPRLPSKACKLTAALAAKSYSAAGQAASALHAMAILQVHQAKALKQVHEGTTDPGLMQELRTATDFALRATKVTARSLGKAMSTMVVQERHLWLNLAEMKDVDKARFLDTPISQGGLFGDTVEGFAQQFSAVQQQTEAIQHILPRRDAPSTAAPGARPQSARRRGRLPASSRAAPPQAESTHRPVRRASRRRAAPPASQPGPKSSRKSTKRPWRRQPGDVGVCSFSGDGENSAAPSPGGGPGGESSVSFCFCSGTHLLKERAISFSSGFSGPWDDSVRRPASSLSPTTHFASSQESTVRGRLSSPRTSGQSRSGPREFGEDASERTAFCAIHPYSLSLHHHRYGDCAIGAACTASGGVAHAAQPVSLAHAHNSTRLRDSVRQATSQVQRRSRDVGGSPERPCLARGDCCPPGKGCNRAGPSSREVFTALTSSYPRKVVAFGQSWICESWTGLCTSSRSRCWRTGAWSNAFSPRIGLQRSTWRTLTFTFRSFRDTDRFYGLHSKVGHGSTGSSPSGSPCLPVCSRRL